MGIKKGNYGKWQKSGEVSYGLTRSKLEESKKQSEVRQVSEETYINEYRFVECEVLP